MTHRQDEDPEFLDFLSDFSVTRDELAAVVRMPELSVAEVKRRLRGGVTTKAPSRRAAAAVDAR